MSTANDYGKRTKWHDPIKFDPDYKAHAERLAEKAKEVLRIDALPLQFATNSQRIRLKKRAVEELREALAQWEAAISDPFSHPGK